MKCFTGTPPPDVREHYQAINDYLAQHISQLPFLVRQTWIDRGIHINGQDWPFVKSQYVKHVPLGAFLGNADSLRDKHRKTLIAKLAKQWLGIITTLESLNIAHSDLDITNVLVCRTLTSFRLRLIDFDSMYVPSLVGRELWEQGHEHFQPVEPGVRRFNNEMDRFSALVIYISLIALAEQPLLWEECGANDENKLLLGAEDFRNLRASKAYQRLRKMPENQVLQKCLDELAISIMNSCMPRSLPEVLRSPNAKSVDLFPSTVPPSSGRSQLSPPGHRSGNGGTENPLVIPLPSITTKTAPHDPSLYLSTVPTRPPQEFPEDPLSYIPGPLRRSRFFTVTKSYEPHVIYNEDICVISPNENSFALCDGASGSQLPRPWGFFLGQQWLRKPLYDERGLNAEILSQWMQDPRQNWAYWVAYSWKLRTNERNRQANREPITNDVLNKILRSGAAATLLGLQVDNNKWYATAIGDTCLFQIPADGQTLSAMPLTRSSSFTSVPPCSAARRIAIPVHSCHISNVEAPPIAKATFCSWQQTPCRIGYSFNTSKIGQHGRSCSYYTIRRTLQTL